MCVSVRDVLVRKRIITCTHRGASLQCAAACGREARERKRERVRERGRERKVYRVYIVYIYS